MKNFLKRGLAKTICLGFILSIIVVLGKGTKAEAAGMLQGINATFYLMPAGSDSYINVGSGTVKEALSGSNVSFVTNNIVTTPDISKYVMSNQTVEWNKISISGSGKISVKGTVKVTEAKVIANTNNMSGLQAVFYVSPWGSDNYVCVGNGTVKEAKSSSNVNFVKNNVISTPDLSTYVMSNQTVEWNKISVSGSGKISVKGTVNVAQFAASDDSDALSGLDAVFYLMSSDSTSYMSVGGGIVVEAKNSSDASFVTKNIVTTPDLSKYVKENQTVEWNKISVSGSGKITVKGCIETENTMVSDDSKELSCTEEESSFEASLEVSTMKGFVPTEGESAVYNVLKEMLYTGDMSVRDISELKVTANEISDAYARLINGEGYFYYAAVGNVWLSNLGIKNGRCTTAQLCGMDADFINRYTKMMNVIDQILAKMDPRMSDVEKALIAHDYLTENTTYDANAKFRGCAAGILVDRRGLCAGFARAFATIMRAAGITAYDVGSDDMNHAWNYVVLDGQIYNVDCTWDTKTKNKSTVFHREYFVASDARFEKAIPNKHYNWVVAQLDRHPMPTTRATSTKYDNWFVHNTTSRMEYCDCFWYYADGTRIIRSDIEGKNVSTVLTESSNISIISLSQGVLQYKVNGIIKTVKVK